MLFVCFVLKKLYFLFLLTVLLLPVHRCFVFVSIKVMLRCYSSNSASDRDQIWHFICVFVSKVAH